MENFDTVLSFSNVPYLQKSLSPFLQSTYYSIARFENPPSVQVFGKQCHKGYHA